MKKASRGRGLRVGIAGAAAALATLCFGASQAQAVPFQAQLDNAFLKTGAFPNPGLDILDTPDQAVIQGDLTPGAPSTFVTTPAQFQFPDFSGTVLGGAVGVEVSLDALGNINGTVDGTTGAVTTTSTNFKSTLTLDFTPGNLLDPKDICEISPIPMAFNTTQPFPAPYAGDPFTVVLADLATDALDNGAISTTWATLPAATFISGPSGNCATVDSLTGGRGGLWIADGIATPVLNTAPPGTTNPPTNPPTAPKKCKKGQKLKKGKCVKKKKKKKKK